MSRELDKQNESPRIAAVILAAGRSRRMGEQNKLLVNLGQIPMVSHVTAAAVASDARPGNSRR